MVPIGLRKISNMKKSLIILAIIFIVSCTDNSSYFDLNKEGIVSCQESLISKVMIKGLDDNFDYYRFSLMENRNGIGVKFFSVSDINDAFIISTISGKTINNSEFKLKPSSKYEISNVSNGDATQSTITIITDEKGNIVDASVLSCE